jgi:hypothetical protein
MSHECVKHWINIAGGMVACDECGKEYFFTKLGITAKEIIHAGGYDTIEKNGIPQHDIEMIQFFIQAEKEIEN